MHSPYVELRLAGLGLVVRSGRNALGDDLGQRLADDAAAQEDQPADAVDQGVARQDQLRIDGGQPDGQAQAEVSIRYPANGSSAPGLRPRRS